jgi:hypothetical protein
MTAREYREVMDLPVKKGLSAVWLKKLKAEQAIENKTYKNLKAGKKFWYKKGDKRARVNTFYKGRAHEVNKLSQEIYPNSNYQVKIKNKHDRKVKHKV